jgi:hypothetical protein
VEGAGGESDRSVTSVDSILMLRSKVEWDRQRFVKAIFYIVPASVTLLDLIQYSVVLAAYQEHTSSANALA